VTHVVRYKPGFTLIEVIVALSLGVMLAVAVQELLVRSYQAAYIVEQRETVSAVSSLPLELIVADLAQRPAGGGIALQDGTLSLTTTNAMQSERIATRHVVAVSYQQQPDDNGHLRLVRREVELGEEEGEGAEQPGVLLAESLRAIEFEIYDGRTWHSTWPPRVPRSPQAVRVTITHSSGERQQRVIRLAPMTWRRHDE
jgi:prepilin-type N-terminal cleavage/methylation domain-containing protein